MHTRHPLLLVVPILTASLAAQDQPGNHLVAAERIPAYTMEGRPGVLTVRSVTAVPALHAMVAAATDQLVPTPGGLVLSGGVVVQFAAAPQGVAKFAYAVPDPALLGLGAQVVAIDNLGFAAGPVLQTGKVFAAENGFTRSDDSVSEHLQRIELTLGGVDRNELTAAFTGHSDGFGLRVAAIAHHHDVVDVYLALDTPGPGEGMLDVVEHFQAVVKFVDPKAKKVRVRGVEGPDVYGAPLAAYQPLRLLER